jgi:hypothetical protein
MAMSTDDLLRKLLEAIKENGVGRSTSRRTGPSAVTAGGKLKS